MSLRCSVLHLNASAAGLIGTMRPAAPLLPTAATTISTPGNPSENHLYVCHAHRKRPNYTGTERCVRTAATALHRDCSACSLVSAM